MQRWEYLTVKIKCGTFSRSRAPQAKIESKLNGLGADGWELATSFTTTHLYGLTGDVVFLLKRPTA